MIADKRLISYDATDSRINIFYIIAIAALLFLFLVSKAYATQTIFDNVNITKNLTIGGLKVASCDVKANLTGWLYCGTDVTGAGGGGANVSTTTCSGTNKVSAVNNATGAVTCSADVDTDTFNTSSEIWAVIDNNTFYRLNNSIGLQNITNPTNCTAGNLVSGKVGNAWVCTADLFNTSAQIWTVIDNSTFHKFSQQITWGNLSSWSLNNAWTGSLGGGNITSGTISSTQITDGTIATADLAVAFAISLGNVTDNTNCTAAQKVLGKVGSAWVCDTDLFNTSAQMDTTINATANRYFQLKVNESSYLAGQLSTYYLNSTNTSVVYTNSANNSNSTGYFGGQISTYYWNKTGGITFDNITDIENCSAGYYVNGRVGNAWVCAADVSGGGSGANYWQASGTWMWNNATAGGQPNINMTTINATTLNQNGNKVLDVSGGLTWGNISSGWSLNQAWTGSLGGGNITSGTIGSTQITDGTVATVDLASAFAINLGNVTSPSNCSAGQYVFGKVGSAWVCDTDLFNTSAQMKVAVNDTADAYYQIKSKNSEALDGYDSAYFWPINSTMDKVSTFTDTVSFGQFVYLNSSNADSYIIGSKTGLPELKLISGQHSQNSSIVLMSGADIAINAYEDIYATVGDDAGAFSFDIRNLSGGNVFSVDSYGNTTIEGSVTSTNGYHAGNNTKFYFGSEGEYCMFYNSTLGALVSTNNC